MRTEIINRLFQVFGTFDETSQNVNRHGIGLGLTISKQIVGKLGPEEKIHVTSQVGQGSVFSFKIYKDLSKKIEIRNNELKRDRQIFMNPSMENIRTKSRASNVSSPATNNNTKSNKTSISIFHKKRRVSKSCLPFPLIPKIKDYKSQDGHTSQLDRVEQVISKEVYNISNEIGKSVFKSSEQKLDSCKSLSDAESGDFDSLLNVEGVSDLNLPYNFNGGQANLKFDCRTNRIAWEPPKSKISVLIVDDTPFNILIIESFLKSFDSSASECTRAFNGKECLQLVEKSKSNGKYFDLILMDCNMPIMDGFEASSILRRMFQSQEVPQCPILGITAYTGEKIKRRCLDSGMDDYISKPITQEAFFNYLRRWLK